jgi:MscS family membrane protein
VDEGITQVLQQTGLSDETLLFLGYDDWISLAISLLIVLAGYIIGSWLIHSLFPRLVSRTTTTLDDQLLRAAGSEMRWVAVILCLRYAIIRLDFLDPGFKTLLNDILFYLMLFFIVVILWKLVDLAAKQVEVYTVRMGTKDQFETLIRFLVWVARLAILVLAITLTLNHFAVNITGLAVLVAIVGLVISQAGRDIVADVIAGVTILFDRPYHVGDRIELLDLDTKGDVVDIGMRSTRVVTLDNRLVIVPNSQMAKNKVVNLNFPDPSFYDKIFILVAYENDIERIIQALTEKVCRVEGVQKDRGVDVQLKEYNEYHVRVMIGWWIAFYGDVYKIRDRVSRAAMQTLQDAGVSMPYSKGQLNVEMNSNEE